MRKRWFLAGLLLVALVAVACGGDDDTDTTAPGGTDGASTEAPDGTTTGSTATDGTDAAAAGACADAAGGDDLLAQVCADGVIRVSTDPAYPPQSFLNPDTEEYEGFDIDVATEIANRLGVEIEWEEPAWELITAGSWNDRWDMSVGSMTVTNDRQEVLYFTDPYYFTPAVMLVHEDNTSVQDVTTDLDGATIGACAACTYQQFIEKTLAIEGFEFDFVIDDATFTGYDTDTTALQDLALGDGARLDAAMTSLTVAEAFAAENPVKVVGDPLFYEPLSVAFDRNGSLDATSLVEAVDAIVAEMHADGTLTTLSEEWFDGVDLTTTQ